MLILCGFVVAACMLNNSFPELNIVGIFGDFFLIYLPFDCYLQQCIPNGSARKAENLKSVELPVASYSLLYYSYLFGKSCSDYKNLFKVYADDKS